MPPLPSKTPIPLKGKQQEVLHATVTGSKSRIEVNRLADSTLEDDRVKAKNHHTHSHSITGSPSNKNDVLGSIIIEQFADDSFDNRGSGI